jgi:hypothetical protein
MSNPQNICSDTAYLNSIDQKTRFQLFNIPANRYNNLANNPYTKINPATSLPYTKFDLDMRRKAEILKHASNRTSTQTNNLTQAQIYAQAMKTGSYQKRTYSNQFIAENTVNGIVEVCPPGVIIKTPSSASDVPGNLLLYDDPAIPLYNFVNDNTTASYGIINQELDPYGYGFQYTNEKNILSTSTPSTIFTTYMFNSTLPNYIFAFSTPTTIKIQGVLNSGYTTTSGPLTFQIQLNSVSVNVNYSHSSMYIREPINYNINNYPITNQPILNISVNPNSTTFNGSFYLGVFNVSNIVLPTSLGYIYDFQLSISYSILYPTDSKYPEYYYQPSIATIYNATNATIPNQTNCTITPVNPPIPPAPPQIYPTLTVSGIPSL